MYRACELKDETYKKTRTLHFSEYLAVSWFQQAAHDRLRIKNASLMVLKSFGAVAFSYCAAFQRILKYRAKFYTRPPPPLPLPF